MAKDLRIYVASSWWNELQPRLVTMLIFDGYEVYDFRNPREGDKGFHWSEIDKDWQHWTPEQYALALHHPVAEAGFKSDMDAMEWADIFIGLQPFGRSASLEMGWAVGQGKRTILMLNSGEPELMVKMIDHICCDYTEVQKILREINP